MRYEITQREKRLQHNLFVQLYRLVVLSIKFMKLTRTGCQRLDEAGRTGSSEARAQAPRQT